MVEPLWWTIAKGVALGYVLVFVGGLVVYGVGGWLYRQIRKG